MNFQNYLVPKDENLKGQTNVRCMVKPKVEGLLA
jgi:hypothetical protein